jgi:hypothetical protein
MAMSPKTERTLQEIDRDINQIWQELQARIYPIIGLVLTRKILAGCQDFAK